MQLYDIPTLLCLNNNSVFRLCKDVKCTINPIICKVNRCVCENNHKKCNTVLYDTLIETIQEKGLLNNETFNQEITKIKKIYEKLQQVIKKQKCKFEGWIQDLKRGLKHTQFLELIKNRSIKEIDSRLVYDTEKEMNEFKVKIFDQDESDEFIKSLDKIKTNLSNLQKNIAIRPQVQFKIYELYSESQLAKQKDIQIEAIVSGNPSSLRLQLSPTLTIDDLIKQLKSGNHLPKTFQKVIVKDGGKNLLNKSCMIGNIMAKNNKRLLYLLKE